MNQIKPTIYLKEPIHEEAVNYLNEHAVVVDDFNNTAIQGIVTRGEIIDKPLMLRLPNLKVIGKHGVGYDNIDIQSAHELGICVVFTPGCNTEAVAELAVTHILSVYRRIIPAYDEVRSGKNEEIAPAHFIGREVYGKTVGLVGIGRIGRRIGDILRSAFKVTLIGYDPFVSDETFDQLGIYRCTDLLAMCSVSDIVNISIPFSKDTENLINADVLASFKKDAILVNSSRGNIVNEKDLYDALRSHRLYGAGMDVFAEEPIPGDNPLLLLPNFVATPHIGASTDEAILKMGMTVVQDVLRVVNGASAMFPVK